MKGCALAVGGIILAVVLWFLLILFGALLIWVPLYFIWNYGVVYLYPHTLTWSQVFGLACVLSLGNAILSKSSSSSK